MSGMDPRIAEWLASGDTGSSSKAIMLWLSSGVRESAWGASEPHDPSDLGRCLRLLDRIPEWKPRMAEMAGAGGYWPTFAKRWHEMAQSMIDECGGTVPGPRDRADCPRTYALMQRVRDEAAKADKPGFTEIKLGGKLAGVSMRFGK
jgi:hypothetical protein